MSAIEFENISKQYRLGLISTRTLSHDLNRWWKMNIQGKEDPYLKIGEVNDRAHKGTSDYVWALKDINFKIDQGDVLGIIGKNGAGKSTLLKILSKVTSPSTGTIRAKGRIASLLEVGTGFHPEMTGRENIYMNGSIMGMTKTEITRKFDEIVDFSGLERYIDTPVKRYSSGMTVRLGFAIAAHLEPEILVVDEVLAVGDAEFQNKAIGKMQDVSKGEGRTVLFVSHNMGSILQLCNKGILMNNGTVAFQGEIRETVDMYLMSPQQNSEYHVDKDSNMYIKSLRIVDKNNCTVSSIGFDKNIYISWVIERKMFVNGSILGFNISTAEDIIIFSKIYELSSFVGLNNQIDIKVKIPSNFLMPGHYKLNTAIHVPNVELIDTVFDKVGFEIVDTGSLKSLLNGNIGFINPEVELI